MLTGAIAWIELAEANSSIAQALDKTEIFIVEVSRKLISFGVSVWIFELFRVLLVRV